MDPQSIQVILSSGELHQGKLICIHPQVLTLLYYGKHGHRTNINWALDMRKQDHCFQTLPLDPATPLWRIILDPHLHPIHNQELCTSTPDANSGSISKVSVLSFLST